MNFTEFTNFLLNYLHWFVTEYMLLAQIWEDAVPQYYEVAMVAIYCGTAKRLHISNSAYIDRS